MVLSPIKKDNTTFIHSIGCNCWAPSIYKTHKVSNHDARPDRAYNLIEEININNQMYCKCVLKIGIGAMKEKDNLPHMVVKDLRGTGLNTVPYPNFCPSGTLECDLM